MSSDDEQTLLSVADVLRMVAERESLNARVKALNAQLDLVRNLVGPERFDEMVGDKIIAASIGKKRPNILRGAILKALEPHPKGLTYDDLRGLLKEELEGYSPNTLFNTVSLMFQRKEIGKIGRRLFHRPAFDALSPEDRQNLGETLGRPAVRTVILSLLKERGKGMTAGEIKDHFEARHGAVGSNAVYTALSRLATKDGLVERDEESGRYMLVSGSNEP